MGIILEIKRRE